jgi:hypothetical protein
MNTKNYLLAVLSVCAFFPLQAQQAVRNDSLLNRELTLEKEYNPTIKDAVKLSQLPELREPQSPKSKVEFSNFILPYSVQSGLNLLKPQAYSAGLNFSTYRGYLTVGISSLLDIDGDLGYQILHSDKTHLGLFVSHRSSNSKISSLQIKEKQEFKINDNWAGLDFRHDLGRIELSVDAKYTYSAFNYSGLTITNLMNIWASSTQPPDLSPIYGMNSFPNQNDHLFEVHAGLASKESTETSYQFDAAYTSFSQKYGSYVNEPGRHENRFLTAADLHKKFNSTMGIGITAAFKNYTYSSFPDFNSYELNKELGNINYSVISPNPYFYLESDNLDLRLGGKVDLELGGREKITWSPDVRFNYYPSDRFLFYLLAEGGRKDNSNYELFYENRYINPWIRVWDSRTAFDGTAGVKILPLSNVSIDFFGGYKRTEDEHFYRPFFNVVSENSLYGTVSGVDYRNANTLKIGANVQYAFQNRLEVGVKGVYYQWKIRPPADNAAIPSDYLQAWYKPRLVADMNLVYRFSPLPLRFNLQYHSEFGRKMALLSDEPFYMNDIHDLSLKATYSINHFFSAYLTTNNLLFRKQESWYGYPTQNFNIMGGISIMF